MDSTADATPKEPQLVPAYSARTPIKPEDFPGSGTGNARGIIPRALEAALADGCAGAEDVLPQEVLQQHGLMGWPQALRALHGPGSLEDFEAACRRLAFQVGCMLFAMQWGVSYFDLSNMMAVLIHNLWHVGCCKFHHSGMAEVLVATIQNACNAILAAEQLACLSPLGRPLYRTDTCSSLH